MPTYTFYDSKTKKEWDDMMPNSEREEYLINNPHISQIPGGFATVGDHLMGVGPKQDNGMTENLQRIAESHPGTPMAERYAPSSSKSTKDIRTRQVLKKHGVI